MKNRKYEFDYLKALCIISVIVTHCPFNEQSRKLVFFPFFVEMAVPIFIVISGYMQCHYILKVIAPYLFVIFVEFVWFVIFKDVMSTRCFFTQLLKDGAIGPGGYYTIIYLQLLVVFPLLFWLYRVAPKSVIIGGVAVCVLLEVLCNHFVSDEVYRLLFVRYLPFALCGIILFDKRYNMKKIQLYSIISLLFIYLLAYTGYTPHIFRRLSGSTLPTAPYALLLTSLFIRYMPRVGHFLDRLLSEIGKSTYYIFLVQMLWFAIGLGSFTSDLKTVIPVNLVICLSAGIAFKNMLLFIEEKIGQVHKIMIDRL